MTLTGSTGGRADDPVLAVIAPNRLAAFRARLGIEDDDPLTADFTGWSKLVLLSRDLAILAPRDATQVAALRYEVTALDRLAALDLPLLPQVLDTIDDPAISPYPLVVCRRLPGAPLTGGVEALAPHDLTELFADLGRHVAQWHDAPVDHTALERRDGLEPVVRFAAALDLTPDERRWSDVAAARTASFDPVLVHGDLHEGQLLVTPSAPPRLSGILDWQTARIDHPFVDFDLGEWGTALWRGHRSSFPALRRSAWAAYAEVRFLDAAAGAAFEWFHACSHLRRLTDDGFPVVHPPEVVGSPAQARADLTAALRAVADLA